MKVPLKQSVATNGKKKIWDPRPNLFDCVPVKHSINEKQHPIRMYSTRFQLGVYLGGLPPGGSLSRGESLSREWVSVESGSL